MATATITDLQSLVNRLTADNNRLRNLVKLYEATFAAMKPGKYYVCSDDGEVSSSYWKSGAAEQFASELAADGTGATVVLVTRRYEAEPAPREDFGVLPGVDYPPPLPPPWACRRCAMSQCELMPMPAPSVMLHNGRPATTSLEVAKIFGKRHDNVVRDIRSIIDNCPKRFTALNFEASNYLDNTGRSLPMFIIFKDGFTLLVMGYTGPEAMRFKLAYIEAFNALETELQRQREGALAARRRPRPVATGAAQGTGRRQGRHVAEGAPAQGLRRSVEPLRPPLRDRQVHATAAGKNERGCGVFDRAGT